MSRNGFITEKTRKWEMDTLLKILFNSRKFKMDDSIMIYHNKDKKFQNFYVAVGSQYGQGDTLDEAIQDLSTIYQLILVRRMNDEE